MKRSFFMIISALAFGVGVSGMEWPSGFAEWSLNRLRSEALKLDNTLTFPETTYKNRGELAVLSWKQQTLVNELRELFHMRPGGMFRCESLLMEAAEKFALFESELTRPESKAVVARVCTLIEEELALFAATLQAAEEEEEYCATSARVAYAIAGREHTGGREGGVGRPPVAGLCSMTPRTSFEDVITLARSSRIIDTARVMLKGQFEFLDGKISYLSITDLLREDEACISEDAVVEVKKND